VDEDLFNIAQHWPELRRTIAHLRYDANSSSPNEATIRLHVHGLLPKVFGLERIPENTRLAIQPKACFRLHKGKNSVPDVAVTDMAIFLKLALARLT